MDRRHEPARVPPGSSRVTHRLLVKLPDDAGAAAVEAFAARLRSALSEPAFFRIETSAEGQPEMRRGVDRTERFLGLVALLSLVVGGVGVAQTVRAWLSSRLDSIAVLKALGARPREILAIYLAPSHSPGSTSGSSAACVPWLRKPW